MRDTNAEADRPAITEEVKEILDEVSSKLKSGLAARLAERAPIVQKVAPTKKRRYTMGFGPTPIEAGATAPMLYQTRIVFRGEILINTGDKDGLVMRRFTIDNKSYFEDLWGLPVVEFCERVSERNKETPMVGAADWFQIEVENTNSIRLVFAASLLGHIVR